MVDKKGWDKLYKEYEKQKLNLIKNKEHDEIRLPVTIEAINKLFLRSK